MGLNEHDAQVQALYARWLDAATRVGFAVSLLSFLVYLSGALPPYVPLESLPQLWRLPVARYLAATGAPTGWGWLALLGRGDYLNFAGIALFALVTTLCYLRILPALLARRDRWFALIAALEIAVLLAAATGLALA